MEIKLRRASTVYIIDIVGDVDLYNAFKLKDVVRKMLERRIQSYIINLEQVEYIDSSGIGALLFVHSELKKQGFELRITGVKGSVKRVIELTKLMEYLPIVDELAEAVRQLKPTL